MIAPFLAASSLLLHIGPSADANNRYVKITLLPDQIRIVYTVFFGDRPGAGERRRIDEDGNGALSEKEGKVYGERLRDQVGGSLLVTIDGVRPETPFEVSDVGLGTPTTSAGAFSVDLTLTLPLPDPMADSHTLRFDDRLQLPLAGEGETRVEESPGVHVTRAAMGEAQGIRLHYTFNGNPRNDRGLRVDFTVDRDLRKPRAAGTSWIWLAIAAGGAAMTVGSLWLLRKRQRKL